MRRPLAPHTCADGRLNAPAAAAYLGVTTGTLRTWRCKRRGPAHVHAGQIWYYQEDLDTWLKSQRFDPCVQR